MLAEALVAQGVPVSELSYSWHPVPGEKKAILFFHWPDEFFFARNPRQQLRTLLLLANLWWGRVVRRQKIVWLAHNVLPHERNGRPFGFARRGCFAALDGGSEEPTSELQSLMRISYAGLCLKTKK